MFGGFDLLHTWHGIDVLVLLECLLVASFVSLFLIVLALGLGRRRLAVWAFVSALLFSTAAWAANTKLSSLTSAASVSGTDLFYDVQTAGSGGVKATAAQIGAYFFGLVSGSCTATSGGLFTCSTTAPQFTSFATPGTASYTIPSWAQSLELWMMSAGAGGGSGAREATGVIRTGGGGGAGGGAQRAIFNVSAFGGAGATIPIFIGAGGIGGASQTTNSTAGSPGIEGHVCGVGTIYDFVQTSTTNTLNGLAYGAGVYVAVGASGTIVETATPLTASSWATQTSGTANNLTAVIFVGGTVNLFVAVGAGGTIVTSANGTTWTVQTSGTTNQLNDIIFDGTTLVAVGNSGTILTSTNATSWATNAYSSANNLTAIANNGTSQYIVVDSAGNIVSATIATGTYTASLITPSASYGLTGIAYNGSNFWVATGNAGYVYTSANGASWNAGSPLLGRTSNAVVYSNGYFFTNAYHSADGANWYPAVVYVGSVGGPKSLVYNSGEWYDATGLGNVAYWSSVSTYAWGNNGAGPGGAGSTSNATGGNAVALGQIMYAGANGAASSSTSSASGPGGGAGVSGAGGAGGSADASNNNRAGSVGGTGSQLTGTLLLGSNAGVAGGASPGIAQGASGSQVNWGGAGGGGGAYNVSTAGQSGGAGANPGGGGGGGGAADNGFSSGAGGAGGNCELRIFAHAT